MKRQQLSDQELKKVKLTKAELLKQEENFRKKEQELENKDKLTPWNVDTICKEGFSKSIINKSPKEAKELSEDEQFEQQKDFQDKYRDQLQHYGMLSKAADSRRYLQDNPHLISDKAANYLVIWCIDLQVEEKTSLMEQVAHQTIILQFILQLGIQMKTDPRDCYMAFFKRFETMQAEYIESFNDELNAFKGRVKERARIRIEEAVKRYEEEQRQQEMGPGGLHPADVMETLPAELRECFEKQDVPMLQKVIKEMDTDQAKYHMKRCVAAGLWVPEGKSKDGTENTFEEGENGSDGEYEVVSENPPETSNKDGTQV
ncbi:unnamed protein product [Clavelina lepadiformis]|uniref:Hsp90 chaperone protein kinase-targeting subunit n=1 Tax=Clavelina lepadiformis TaxID=159417 RepID=A0ABP0F7U0_CLALP